MLHGLKGMLCLSLCWNIKRWLWFYRNTKLEFKYYHICMILFLERILGLSLWRRMWRFKRFFMFRCNYIGLVCQNVFKGLLRGLRGMPDYLLLGGMWFMIIKILSVPFLKALVPFLVFWKRDGVLSQCLQGFDEVFIMILVISHPVFETGVWSGLKPMNTRGCEFQNLKNVPDVTFFFKSYYNTNI